MNLRHLFSLCAVVALPVAALAQTPPPAAAPVTAVPAPAAAPATPSGCEKPPAYVGTSASDDAKRAWQKSLDTFSACIRKFSDEQRGVAELAIRSGNDAVAEYNAVVQSVRDQLAKPKG